MKDAQGHALSGANEQAAEIYGKAAAAFNSGHGDAIGLSDQALAAAPAFAMPHIVKAWAFTLGNDPIFMVRAKAGIPPAEGLNEREQAHVKALGLATSGERAAAVGVLDRHLMDYPRDLVAHQAATLLDSFIGRFHLARDRSARALPHWDKDMPGYGGVLAFLAMGLEEAGDYARAEDTARDAAEREPHSFWPHHTVAHVMEMTGRPQDGLGWMAVREKYWSAPENVTRVHIWWHRSLYHVELGQYDDALALYDGPIMDSVRPVGNALCNPSALLWRLDTLGCDVGTRWTDLTAKWDGHADGKTQVFIDMHAAMAELRAGQEAAVERRLATMRDTAAATGETAAIYRDVGIPLVEGLFAFHRGDYAQAVETLMPIRFDVWRIGGSHAQRDVVAWTLTEATIRGRIAKAALALAHERIALRPRSVVNRQFLSRAERIAA